MADVIGKNITQLLSYLQYAQQFPDFPTNISSVPSLVDPNYVPPFNGLGVYISNWIAMSVALLVVIARLCARAYRGQKRFGWDDWVIIPATISVLGYNVATTLGVSRGCVGLHTFDCTIDQLQAGFMIKYVGLQLYALSSALIKFSIGLFCLRLAPRAASTYRKYVIAANVLVIAVFVAAFPTTTVTCLPAKASWTLSVAVLPTTRCIREWKLVAGWAVVYSVIDVLLICLPVYLVLGLSFRKRAKAGLILIFLFGATAVAISFYKLAVTKSAYDTYDQAW
jgi:hypothetical protein